MDAVIKAAAMGNTTAQACIEFNQAAATKFAATYKRDGVVPGIRFEAVTQIQHRAI
jgi:hypothetical protein